MTVVMAHSSGQSADGTEAADTPSAQPDPCIGGSFARLLDLMLEVEAESMDLLAERFGAPWTRIPTLVKLMEDSLVWRLYGEAMERGGHDATHRAAVRHVSRKLGASKATVRYRVEAIQLAIGLRESACGYRPR